MSENCVTVMFFAMLREQRGASEAQVTLEGPETVGALYARLFPPGAAGALPVAFAVNHAYVEAERLLVAGDEVAFIPPLGGG